MSIRRASTLLAALALLAPLAAAAMPVCAPGQHCPMATADGVSPPCHGTAVQADDCCPDAAATEPVEVAPPTIGTAPTVADATPTPRLEVGDEIPTALPDEAPPAPLYRLFRALLI